MNFLHGGDDNDSNKLKLSKAVSEVRRNQAIHSKTFYLKCSSHQLGISGRRSVLPPMRVLVVKTPLSSITTNSHENMVQENSTRWYLYLVDEYTNTPVQDPTGLYPLLLYVPNGSTMEMLRDIGSGMLQEMGGRRHHRNTRVRGRLPRKDVELLSGNTVLENDLGNDDVIGDVIIGENLSMDEVKVDGGVLVTSDKKNEASMLLERKREELLKSFLDTYDPTYKYSGLVRVCTVDGICIWTSEENKNKMYGASAMI